MKIVRISTFSGKENVMDLDVTNEQLNDWLDNKKCIQDVFPNLLPDEREFLMSGITPAEWDHMFGSDEE